MLKRKTKSDASLSEELPYWEFQDHPRAHLILNDGSLVAGIKLPLLDIECFDEERVNDLHIRLRGILNSIAENLSVQFCFSVGSNFENTINKHIDGKIKEIHPLIESIAKYREEQLWADSVNGELYKPELFIYLKVNPTDSKKLSFLKSKKEFSNSSLKNYEESLDTLFENLDTLNSSFSTLGLQGKILNSNEIKSHIYKTLNPKRSTSVETPNIVSFKADGLGSDVLSELPWLADTSPREQLVFGDLILGADSFVLDGYCHKVLTLKTLPEFTCAGEFSNFLRLPFHYDLTLSFDVPAQASELSSLQQKRKMAHSLAITSGNNASDLESETKLNSTEELIRELLSTGQRIYPTQLQIVLRALNTIDGVKKLNRQIKEVLSRFRSLQGAEGLEETVGSWRIFKNNLPAAPVSLDRAKKLKTNNLVDFIPIYGVRLGDDEPVVIFRNRLNGLVSFNPFDSKLPNYNALVTGSSGAGKSFLNNCILTQELARGLKVFIIDIGGSYKKLTHALGGEYLEINLSEKYRLNPFDIGNQKTPPDQKLKTLLAVIESMASDDEKSKLSKLDRVLLEKAITELYEEKSAKDETPILSDLAKKLSENSSQEMINLSKILYIWTGDRPFGKLLDGHGSLKTDSPICTFDLKGLSNYPDLQSVMILLLTDFILTQVESNKTCKKRIILDEAWQLLKSNAAANFMEYCARTLRKTGSGITFITQGVEEIIESPIGSAIMNNTATKFILLQRGDSKTLQDALKLNSQEINLIYSLEQRKGEFSEGLLIEGDHRQVIRIHPTPFEYWLSTSDAQDNHYLETLKDKGLSLVSAIEEAAKNYPNGIGKEAAHEK